MSNSVDLTLNEPGTFLYTPERALEGHQLTLFGLSLRRADNRAAFLADPSAYMTARGLSDEERALVTAQDWTGLLRKGAHLQSILKISATLGGNLWDIGAHNTGLSVPEIMALCPRNVSAVPGGEH
ncbi:extradiol ring-cleavage dioxygenase [Arenibacterium sp. LLYu02]|uniref:extradiol ring-cleavage dioxygenase n=1 Tax=Arenibacterium sp. LLYu02 TaxID=3404132 RepID=UPI003B21E89E